MTKLLLVHFFLKNIYLFIYLVQMKKFIAEQKEPISLVLVMGTQANINPMPSSNITHLEQFFIFMKHLSFQFLIFKIN